MELLSYISNLHRKSPKLYSWMRKLCVPVRMTMTDRQRERWLAYYYRARTGRLPDFEEPKAFTEKVLWYSLYYDNVNFASISDKVLFKDYIKDILGSSDYTAKLYGVWTDVADIDFDSLPESFVLKSNCSAESHNIILVPNKTNLDYAWARNEMKRWLDFRNTEVDGFCRAYYDVTPKIFAEEFLPQADVDYKFYCFDGEPYYVNVLRDRFEKGQVKVASISFFDMEWKIVAGRPGRENCVDVPKPKHFEEMVSLARKVSTGIPFVRVDFYESGDRVYFGELMFNPAAGLSKYEPESFDYEMGRLFALPIKTPLGRKHRPDLDI